LLGVHSLISKLDQCVDLSTSCMICIILIWIEYKDYFGWFLPLCAFAASWIFYGDVLVRLYGLVLRNLRLDNAKVQHFYTCFSVASLFPSSYHWSEVNTDCLIIKLKSAFKHLNLVNTIVSTCMWNISISSILACLYQ